MNKSPVSNKTFIDISIDDKKANSKEKKKKNFNNIPLKILNNINNNICNIKDAIKKIFEGNEYKKSEKIVFSIKIIERYLNNTINDINDYYKNQYENLLRYYEKKIRLLYENNFYLELKKRILEESNGNLLRKEKEYELIKEKAGIIIRNGKIIDNNRKENEILILKKENSILKDTIEKQRLNNASKSRKTKKKNAQINKKLIMKLHLKSIKPKILSHHSHPKSNHHYQCDSNFFIKNLSIFTRKTLHKSLHNHSFTKNYNTENITRDSSKKNKTIKNYSNIRIKNLCTKIIEKKQKNGNKYIISKKNKSFNPPQTGTNLNRSIKDSSKEKDSISELKKRNNSECFKDKKVNLLMIKTIHNENNCNKKIKYCRILSPRNKGNSQKNNLIPKSIKPINEIKYSYSFLTNSNINNIKNNKCDSEKLVNNINNNIKQPKKEIKKIKKITNLIIKKNNKSKNKSGPNSKKKNNIHIINYTSINNVMNKTKSNSKKK